MKPVPSSKYRRRWLRTGAVLATGLSILFNQGSLFAQTTFTGQFTGFGSYGHTSANSDLIDHAADLRLMIDQPLTNRLTLQVHYDLAMTAGDSQTTDAQTSSSLSATTGPDDSRRLFDLTHTLEQGSCSLAYHRFDRLSLRWTPDWGSLTVGRTAVTWGHGLVFNVHDLFNPFDPRDIIRDYKSGDDLVLVETRAGSTEWQFLAVPRRNPATGTLSAQQSSLATHVRFDHGDIEWTALVGMHYDEAVAGFGRVATVGDAVWRGDVLLTHLNHGGTAFAALTNIDYSWVWKGKNCYGLIEAHYNSLGHTDPKRSLHDPDLAPRLIRGEVFTLGHAYVAGTLQMEFHPLLNGTATAIVDLDGPSAILQPRLAWDARQNLQFILGAQLPLGARGTEYGGIVDPISAQGYDTPRTIFLWVKAWF